MPHLTQPILPGGPIVEMFVAASIPRVAVLQQANQTPPNPVRIIGVIDTGASATCIDPTSLAPLGLTPINRVPIHTPSTGTAPVECDQYDVQLILLHKTMRHFHIPSLPVVASGCLPGIQALIGRDVLSRCLFVYDGVTGIYSLAF